MKDSNAILFLGSGATFGSGIKKNDVPLPTDSQFFNELREGRILANWKEKYPVLKLYFESRFSKERPSLYETWNDLFIYRAFGGAGIIKESQEIIHKFNELNNFEFSNQESWRSKHYRNQFRTICPKRYKEYYLGEFAIWDLRVLVKEIYDVELSKENKYKNFWKKVEKEIGRITSVVNLNYDTTFDDALKEKCYCFGNPDSSRGKIPIIHPHGSLKWTSESKWYIPHQNWSGGWIHYPESTDIKEIGYQKKGDDFVFEFKQPLIVSPSQIKEEVVGNSTFPGLAIDTLQAQWTKLEQVLWESNHWIILGISFASGDDHLLWLLERAFKNKKKKVSFFIHNNCEKVLKLFIKIFCNDAEHSFEKFFIDGNDISQFKRSA